jgi:hypothetical protein
MKSKYFFSLILGIIVTIVGLSTTSCDDNEASGGTPVITGVRVTDPEKADSLFTDARVGQMIVIVGENLQNAQQVFINDQEVSFNCNYNTSTHLILTIPSDLVVYGADNSLPMEIRVVTSHGTATYAFHVIAGEPTIDYYKADLVEQDNGIYSMVPGMDVELCGSLLHEINKVYITDLDTVKVADVQRWQLNDSCTVLTVVMPNEIPNYGFFVVECYAGTAYCGFSKAPTEPKLYNVIPDMPIPGQTVTLFGKYLKDITAINIGGEIDVPVDGVTTFESMDRLIFTMPEVLPSKNSNGIISVNTLGGRAEIPFYNYNWIYEDFDGNGTEVDWGWGANAGSTQGFSGTDNFDGDNPIVLNNSNYLISVGTTCWWDHNYQWNSKAVVNGIPADTPLDRIYFRYEAYIHEQWSAATTLTNKVTLYHVDKSGIEFKDAATGQFIPGQWMTISVPLSEWGTGDATYGDFCAHNKLGDYDFKLYIEYDNSGDYITLAYDNFRFYVIPQTDE